MNINKILVIKVRGLGDTLLATPALHALRQAWPKSHITVVVSSAGQMVLKDNPHVDEVLVFHKHQAGLGYSLRFLRRLAKDKFDLAIALHASLRTALLALASGAPQRVVHNHSGRNFFSTIPVPAPQQLKSSIERDLDAIHVLDIPDVGTQLIFPLKPDYFKKPQTFLHAQGLSAQKGFLVFAPGSTDPTRRWTAQAAIHFLEQVRSRGFKHWVLLAGPDDQELIDTIYAQSQKAWPVFQGTLQEVGALLKLSQGMVTVNSGPKHIAVALGVRTLTLWTHEPEIEWHPYDRSQHALLRAASGQITDITPAMVVEAVQAHFGNLLSRRSQSSKIFYPARAQKKIG